MTDQMAKECTVVLGMIMCICTIINVLIHDPIEKSLKRIADALDKKDK